LRELLAARGVAAAAFGSGWARPRNFEHNVYPFRAESHFLYLVGQALEGAILLVAGDDEVLYVTEPDPAAVVWNGELPSCDELSRKLELEVRPLEECEPPVGTALLPPQDQETADWLAALLDREVTACSGPDVDGPDELLANAMIELRLRHDAAALEQMRQAAHVTARAHEAGLRATRVGAREALVRASMECEIVAAGMVPAYGSIVTKHGETLHELRQHRVLETGDLLLADVGAETPEGWAADVTRTWPVSGRFTSEQRELYEVVLGAQRAAIQSVRPGVRYLDVHRTAAHVLGQGLVDLGILHGDVSDLYQRGAIALFFPHGVGHLLGLDVHDMEDLGDRAGYPAGHERSPHPGEDALRLDRVLEPDMVVTIEPGFYQNPALLRDPDRVAGLVDCVDWSRLERFGGVRGIRIEDDVRVTAGGSEVLTESIPKTPSALEELVGRLNWSGAQLR
jgi:Xaa-Pro aminopeptidase